MHQQNNQLREVELRIPLSAVETWGFEALVSIWQAHEDDLRLQCVSCRGSHATLLIETSQPLDTTFAAIEYITKLRLVGRGPGRFEYLLETDAPCCQESLDECESDDRQVRFLMHGLRRNLDSRMQRSHLNRRCHPMSDDQADRLSRRRKDRSQSRDEDSSNDTFKSDNSDNTSNVGTLDENTKTQMMHLPEEQHKRLMHLYTRMKADYEFEFDDEFEKIATTSRLFYSTD